MVAVGPRSQRCASAPICRVGPQDQFGPGAELCTLVKMEERFLWFWRVSQRIEAASCHERNVHIVYRMAAEFVRATVNHVALMLAPESLKAMASARLAVRLTRTLCHGVHVRLQDKAVAARGKRVAS